MVNVTNIGLRCVHHGPFDLGPFIHAVVEVEDQNGKKYLYLSRYLKKDLSDWDEDEWVIDGVFLSNGLPLYFNGEGSRAVMLRRLNTSTSEQAAEIEETLEKVLKENGYYPPVDKEKCDTSVSM